MESTDGETLMKISLCGFRLTWFNILNDLLVNANHYISKY